MWDVTFEWYLGMCMNASGTQQCCGDHCHRALASLSSQFVNLIPMKCEKVYWTSSFVSKHTWFSQYLNPFTRDAFHCSWNLLGVFHAIHCSIRVYQYNAIISFVSKRSQALLSTNIPLIHLNDALLENIRLGDRQIKDTRTWLVAWNKQISQ